MEWFSSARCVLYPILNSSEQTYIHGHDFDEILTVWGSSRKPCCNERLKACKAPVLERSTFFGGDISIGFDMGLGAGDCGQLRRRIWLEISKTRSRNVQQVRRHIVEMMLRAAIDKNEPFETCWKYWTELLSLGFYRIERRCHATWAFAYYCAEQQKADIGLGLLEPLIVELERLLAEVDKPGATFYQHHLDLLVKLRAKLEAERA